MLDNERFILQLFYVFVLLHGCLGLPPKIDLGIAIDTTTDMGVENMRTAGELITQLIERLSISPGTTRIGFYSISNVSREHFQFKTHVNRKCLLKALDDVQFRYANRTAEFASHVIATFDKLHHASNDVINQRRIYLFLTHSIDKFIVAMKVKVMKHSNTDFMGAVLVNSIDKLDQQRNSLNNTGLQILTYKKRNDVYKILNRLQIPNQSYIKCKEEGEKIRDECDRECTCINATLTDCFRIRHEFTAMSLEERRRYLRVYTTVTSTSPYKEIYERFVFMHYKYFCWGIHTTHLFLPWHRWFISVFEDLLRQVDCRVTLPYWDWSYVSNNPWDLSGLWRSSDDGLGGNGTSEDGYCVQTGMFRESEWETPYWEDPLDIILSIVDRLDANIEQQTAKLSFCLRRAFKGLAPSYESIQRTLNLPPKQFLDFDIQIRHNYHDRMHNIIGGTMCTHYAGNTPEFFLHHAFLDKIWYRWQQKSLKHKYVHYLQLNKTNMIGCGHTQKDLIDSHFLPRCIKVKYTKFPVQLRKKRGDEIDDMSRKSAKFWKKYLVLSFDGSFPNCSRSAAEKKRAKYLHRKLDLGWEI